MKTKKMSLKNIKDVLSRDEMKRILAGSGIGGGSWGLSCSASPNCCSQKSCSCDGSGTCTSDDHSATCTCDSGKTFQVSCDPAL